MPGDRRVLRCLKNCLALPLRSVALQTSLPASDLAIASRHAERPMCPASCYVSMIILLDERAGQAARRQHKSLRLTERYGRAHQHLAHTRSGSSWRCQCACPVCPAKCCAHVTRGAILHPATSLPQRYGTHSGTGQGAGNRSRLGGVARSLRDPAAKHGFTIC